MLGLACNEDTAWVFNPHDWERAIEYAIAQDVSMPVLLSRIVRVRVALQRIASQVVIGTEVPTHEDIKACGQALYYIRAGLSMGWDSGYKCAEQEGIDLHYTTYPHNVGKV